MCVWLQVREFVINIYQPVFFVFYSIHVASLICFCAHMLNYLHTFLHTHTESAHMCDNFFVGFLANQKRARASNVRLRDATQSFSIEWLIEKHVARVSSSRARDRNIFIGVLRACSHIVCKANSIYRWYASRRVYKVVKCKVYVWVCVQTPTHNRWSFEVSIWCWMLLESMILPTCVNSLNILIVII